MNMDGPTLAIIFATFFGPIAAVQAQKWIEAITRKRSEKIAVFASLMYTRGTRLSMEHVQALNRIELAFYKDKNVMSAWSAYLDILSVPETSENSVYLQGRRDDLFVDLLYAISQRLGYPFTKTEIKNSTYRPKAHVDLENSQQNVLAGLAGLVNGTRVLRVANVEDVAGGSNLVRQEPQEPTQPPPQPAHPAARNRLMVPPEIPKN